MNWLHYKKIYFLISGIVLGLGIFSLLSWGLRLGVDFRGGTILEYRFKEEVSADDVKREIEAEGIEVSNIQPLGNSTYLFKLPPQDVSGKNKIEAVFSRILKSQADVLRYETVGPSVGPELVKKTIYAIIIASVAILAWVAIQFKSIKFGTSAILAMFHDSFVLIGLYSFLGHVAGAEVDFLFVTALLTTLSFSVHDTIVVYDRIRESQKILGGDLVGLANRAITETMSRSLNNSFTIIFMLFALMLLGGETIKWFALALFIGTVSGTYSSPFVAVPLLVIWDELQKKIKK
jgi:preprotein translocase subunit SecF